MTLQVELICRSSLPARIFRSNLTSRSRIDTERVRYLIESDQTSAGVSTPFTNGAMCSLSPLAHCAPYYARLWTSGVTGNAAKISDSYTVSGELDKTIAHLPIYASCIHCVWCCISDIKFDCQCSSCGWSRFFLNWYIHYSTTLWRVPTSTV